MGPDLVLALALADAADGVSLPRFRAADLAVTTKPDSTPVTDADTAVERAVRKRLAAERPDDGVLGEEQGYVPGTAGRRWIVDPIDGTRNFSRGIPVWATLIALESDGELVLGVVSAPALGKRWHAERGGGAWCGPERLRVSQVSRIEDAVLSIVPGEPGEQLAVQAWHPRGYGDFWAHMLVAEGGVDGAFDAVGIAVWDLAALQPIVEEAGGRLTDAEGERRIDTGSAVSSNGLLHGALLEALAAELR